MAGRPRALVRLTADQIEELAAIGCTDDEIARVAGVSEATLCRHFDAHLKKGRADLKIRLRRRQIQRAEEGSDTMLIWLGKVYLGQRDRTEISGPDGGPIPVATYDYGAAAARLAARPGPGNPQLEDTP